MKDKLSRRDFNARMSAALGAAVLSAAAVPTRAASYRGPNVVIVRFGGGVRRAETIVPGRSWAPYLLDVVAPRGVLVPDVRIADVEGMDTSHAEGTINILTGRYAAWEDAGSGFLVPRIEPTAPTLFEYLRKAYSLSAHQALLINGEDRPQEEFFSFAKHRKFGGDFRAEVLSLYRYKRWLYTRLSNDGVGDEKQLRELRAALTRMKKHELLGREPMANSRLDKFWQRWRSDYGDTGLVNPRGDRLLTELAVRAMHQLRPRLMMVNYQDPDYVHWGVPSHYTRAVAIIDQGLRRLVEASERLEHYAGRTVFVVIPDCGRDNNPLSRIPYQHHFNTDSAREIWAVLVGPGIARGKRLESPVEQNQIAATVGTMMGFDTPHAEGAPIAGVFS